MKPAEFSKLADFAVREALRGALAGLTARLERLEAQPATGNTRRSTTTTKAVIPAALAVVMRRLQEAGFAAEQARADLEAQGARPEDILDALLGVEALVAVPKPRGRVVKVAQWSA